MNSNCLNDNCCNINVRPWNCCQNQTRHHGTGHLPQKVGFGAQGTARRWPPALLWWHSCCDHLFCSVYVVWVAFYLSFGIKHMFAQFSDFSKPVFQYNKMYSHRNSCYVCRPAFVVGLYIGVARFFGLQAARFHLFCFLFYEYVQRHIVKMLVSIHVSDSFLSCLLERV